MAVTVRQTKRGKAYGVRYRDASGRQVRETLGLESEGWTKARAREVDRERAAAVSARRYVRPDRVLFRDHADRWLEGQGRLKDWSSRTVAVYTNVVRHLNREFGSMTLGEIRPRHVAAWVAAHELGPQTVNQHVSVLQGILDAAVREELIEVNPAARAPRPKVGRRQWRVLEPTEVQAVLRELDGQARTVFLTAALTGLRRHELENLRWRDVDLVDMVLRVRRSKTERGERSIALPATVAEALWQHRRQSPHQADGDRVFYSATGGPLRPAVFRQEFQGALSRVGITDYVRPFHDLRHTAATNAAAAGVSPIALMSQMGHGSMATTNLYLHLAGVVFRDEADALERRALGANRG
jgi:integrase